jgi:hypothetical protein
MFIILKHSLAWMVFGASRPSFKFPRYVIQVSVELSKLKLPTIESERPRPASAVQCPCGGDLVGSSIGLVDHWRLAAAHTRASV